MKNSLPLYLLIFSLLMCYVITLTSNAIGTETDVFLSFLLPLSDCFLLSLMAYALSKVKLGWLVSVPVIVILFAELFTVFFYHSNFTVYVIQLIFETNASESSEFIRAALAHPGTWYAVAITIVTALVAWGITYKIQQRKNAQRSVCQKDVCGVRKFNVQRVSLAIAVILIAWSVVRQVSAYYKLYRCFSSASTAVCNDTRYIPHLNTPFVRLAYGTAYNLATSAELDELESTVAATTVDSCSFRCPLIVLVIGESYNKHHTPLYQDGYLPTTPHLMQQHEQGNLVVFTDAVAPFNFTSNAFKYMFTTWDEESDDQWTHHTLFPAVFKKAGYCVDFYTNQFAMGQTDNWNLAGGTIFNRPRLSELQFTHRNPDVFEFDGQLLSQLPPVDTLTAQPTLLILHFIGQHVNYSNRYPTDFAKFTADDEKTLFGGNTGRQTAAHYDNALLYNDHVLNTLFQYLRDKDAIAILLADHGEEVYDWRDKYERTNERTITPEIARYQYEIPLMFYMTPSFRQYHPDVADAVKAAAHRPFISSDLCHLLFYLGGIRHPDYRENRNILSPHYDMHRKRIIRSDVDYDSLNSNPKP